MTTDVIINDDKGYYDFDWTDDGDISTGETLDTAILMSVFNEVRASSAEVPESHRRRGWIGNDSTQGFEQGCKAWEFEQERLVGSTLGELGVVIRNGLQWLIDDGIAINVTVGNPFIKNNLVNVPILFGRSGSEIEKKVFTLWENTGGF
jgi:phage gp46-like protein